MATLKRRKRDTNRIWPTLLFGLAVLAGTVFWLYREPIHGYSGAGAAYGARMACSCRFLAGRELSDCRKDFEPGMQFVFLSEDEEEHSVTAYVPLLASQTATFRDGPGCVLEPSKR